MIVIPMAGLSRRFSEAGYGLPKYMLPARGKTVFAHSVSSFEAYFGSEPFLFIVRDVADTPAFVRAECAALGIADVRIAVLDAPTSGQAETVALGLHQTPADPTTPVTIFNIDTFRPGFRHPDFGTAKTDGYLEVFHGSGANWSYVRPLAQNGNLVGETAEKNPISDLCCTGLYHFDSIDTYCLAYETFYQNFKPSSMLRERYVAPIYNALIGLGLSIRYTVIQESDLILCGVPQEYEAFIAGS